jgi:hypothetical protein
MLRLTEDQLDDGFSAVRHHRYGSFFPIPPELQVIVANWSEFRGDLSKIDLDNYTCYEPLNTFVPKSRLNVRWVSLLHPFDLIIYTSLVLALRNEISAARLSARTRRVYSYRSEGGPSGVLYNPKPSYPDFRKRLYQKASKDGFVGMTDIGDFYPRIYQHRLKNALDAALGDPALRSITRVLEKILNQFSDGVSYGIPVGPPASRPLGEAILIDVDSALVSSGIDFIRFVDDYYIFSRTHELAVAGLHFLGETLFHNHGLTLQTAKTKVIPNSDFIEDLTPLSEKELKRRDLLEIVGDDPYNPTSYDDLNDEQKREIDAFNLADMLSEALNPEQNVDYREVSFVLNRLSALQKPDLIPIVLGNITRLYPVADAVASFFNEFTGLPATEHKNIASVLLRPLLRQNAPNPPMYYAIWILSLFHSNPAWDHADSLTKIFNNAQSPIIKRYAALAIASSGVRAHALSIKDHFRGSPPLLRTAILLAGTKLGDDERSFWRSRLRLTDPLEKKLGR